MIGALLGIVKGNPIKTAIIGVGSGVIISAGIGAYMVGKNIVKDYNNTKAENIALNSRIGVLESKAINDKRTLDAIIDRIGDVEKSRETISNRIARSETNIRRLRNDLKDFDIQTQPIEDSDEKVNLLWQQAINCLENASKQVENCDLFIE